MTRFAHRVAGGAGFNLALLRDSPSSCDAMKREKEGDNGSTSQYVSDTMITLTTINPEINNSFVHTSTEMWRTFGDSHILTAMTPRSQ